MKTKIILGLATLATLAGMAAPAMADDGGRYRDRDDRRGYYTQEYRYQAQPYGYYRAYDRDDYYRAREAREMRERRERIERERREHYARYGYYR